MQELGDDDVDDDTFATGDVVVMCCQDGLVHSFRVLDDGIAERPACGASTSDVRAAEAYDLVCVDCVRVMAEVLECDVGPTMAAVQRVVDRRTSVQVSPGVPKTTKKKEYDAD